MSQIMKDLFVRLLKVYFEDAIALLKIRAATCYVKTVQAVRGVFIISVIFKLRTAAYAGGVCAYARGAVYVSAVVA